MVFSSLTFLCIFLPLVFIGHLLLPGMRAKNVLLACASLLFYAYGEPVYVLLMLVSSLMNWALGQMIGRRARQANQAHPGPSTDGSPRPRGPRPLMALAVILNLGFLAVFKYTGLLMGSLGLLFAPNLPLVALALPIGISFYTFQALSYVIDIYRGQVQAERNYLRVLLYISFFPQLIAGPIIKYHDVAVQLTTRRVTLDGLASGLRRFSVGLAKKVLIANSLGAIADAAYHTPPEATGMAVAWIAALTYMMQIYFDFSGYSDMALGLARMFGFTFKENFDYPYLSRSIQEFWRRWHISLSTWFKEYLYIPLGGNRKGRARTVLNKLLVFGLCGLWHGASWTFLLWGLFHGFFLLLEEYLPLRRLPRVLGWLYAMLVVCVGFVLFRAETLGQALLMLQQMFLGFAPSYAASAQAAFLTDPLAIVIFLLAILACLPFVSWIRSWLTRRAAAVQTLARVFSYLGACGLFVLCLLSLSGSGYNPFIYFRF